MSHCMVPNWSARHQRREDIEGDQERNNRSSQVKQPPQTLPIVVPMSNYEVTWGNREQLIFHGQLPHETAKPTTWNRTGDTLESIVHQATLSNTAKNNQSSNSMPSSSAPKWEEKSTAHMANKLIQEGDLISKASLSLSSAGKQNLDGSLSSMTASSSHMLVNQNDGILKISSMPTYSGGKRVENSSSSLVNKRVRSQTHEQFPFHGWNHRCQAEERASCAGASATNNNNNTGTTMMSTWPSFESIPSFKTGRNIDDHSACQYCSENQDEEFGIKGESSRSQSSRRSRAAVVHNQSERRRRDRINEKMKVLQKLVPNANKTDKASMLDEVIEYLKQLQAQVQLLSINARTIPQMVMPLGMQQQLQMSLLGRMGMGMLDINNLTRNAPQSFPPLLHGATPLSTTPSFISPPIFTVPPVVPSLKANMDATSINTSIPNFGDAYSTFLAQVCE